MTREEVEQKLIEKTKDIMELLGAYIKETGEKPDGGRDGWFNLGAQLNGYMHGAMLSEPDEYGERHYIVQFWNSGEEGNE